MLSLIVMIMVRSAVIQLFTSTMFPEYDPKKGELVIRENSSTADSVTNWSPWLPSLMFRPVVCRVFRFSSLILECFCVIKVGRTKRKLAICPPVMYVHIFVGISTALI